MRLVIIFFLIPILCFSQKSIEGIEEMIDEECIGCSNFELTDYFTSKIDSLDLVFKSECKKLELKIEQKEIKNSLESLISSIKKSRKEYTDFMINYIYTGTSRSRFYFIIYYKEIINSIELIQYYNKNY